MSAECRFNQARPQVPNIKPTFQLVFLPEENSFDNNIADLVSLHLIVRNLSPDLFLDHDPVSALNKVTLSPFSKALNHSESLITALS